MQRSNYSDSDYFVAIPLETEDHAITVEVVHEMVQVAILGPVSIVRMTFTRAEACDPAYRMIEATQRIAEEGR
jgi:hypothetical protein